jgi:flagellar hook-associated protein 1 FlgK
LNNQISVLNQTANTRDGISGVQLDEEGMDLMHYNQSYTAAARLMTTLDEALDTLINKTGVVGR